MNFNHGFHYRVLPDSSAALHYSALSSRFLCRLGRLRLHLWMHHVNFGCCVKSGTGIFLGSKFPEREDANGDGMQNDC